MKTKTFLIEIILGIATLAGAATNELTTALQQGLFEEEANQNLNAAIASYQSLVGAFDKDRQIAATAVFRLGECYRKMGRTNEAAAQYERIVSQFPDQQTLATLSRQNLAGMGMAPVLGGEGSASASAPRAGAPLESLRSEYYLLKAQLDAARKETNDEVVAKIFQDADMGPWAQAARMARETLAKQAASGDTNLDSLGVFKGVLQAAQDEVEADHKRVLDYKEARLRILESAMQLAGAAQPASALPSAASQEQRRLLDEEIKLMEAKIKAKENQVQVGAKPPMDESLVADRRGLLELRRQLAGLGEGTPATPSLAGASGATDEEQQEIRRIQAMIQNSPDLINASDGEDKTPLIRAASKGQITVAGFLLDHGADANKAARGDTPLHEAVQNGHKALVELLLSRGAGVNDPESDNRPLYTAVSRGFNGVIDVLLANKSDVNAKSRGGDTPLHAAARSGNVSVIQLLIGKGAEVNSADDQGRPPLAQAVINDEGGAVQALLAAGADVNAAARNGGTALEEAAAQGRTNIVAALLAAGADVGARTQTGNTQPTPPLRAGGGGGGAPFGRARMGGGNSRNQGGYSPLLLAVRANAAGVVAMLLDHGAPPDVTNTAGLTPLLEAVTGGHVEITKLLLDHKADPNLGGTVSQNPEFPSMQFGPGFQVPAFGHARPIYFPVVNKDITILELLLERGADPNISGAQEPPLVLAINANQPEAVSLLLKYKADPNRPVAEGIPPLESAIDKPAIVSELLAAKADPNAKGLEGRTLLVRAMMAGNLESARLLLDAGARPDERSTFQSTPLHLACEKDNGQFAELFLAHGADPDAKDAVGNTPLHIAVFHENAEAVTELIQKRANLNAQNNAGITPLDLARRGQSGRISSGDMAWVKEGRATQVSVDREQEIARLLAKAGALSDLPRRDRIELRQASENFSEVVFEKGTNDWNHFTLFELIAAHFHVLNTSTAWNRPPGLPSFDRQLIFPDFANITIERTKPDGKERKSIRVNLAHGLEAHDCGADVPLEWGDVVEIPEADHGLGMNWPGLSEDIKSTLYGCISNQVQIVVQGHSHAVQLVPPDVLEHRVIFGIGLRFMLLPVLSESGLVRMSSDMSRVKVTRADPKTGKKSEWVLDCGNAQNGPAFWVRGGDIIEVPDKP